jgi:nicotinamidase-related amidase
MAHGNIRHKSTQALLLIDVVNHFEFPDGKRLLRNALTVAPRLASLKGRARAGSVPIIYVNDNFGQWHSNAAKLLAYWHSATNHSRRGKSAHSWRRFVT